MTEVIPSSEVRTVVQTRNLLGETPLWCPRTETLWWIDIEIPTLHAFVPATGTHTAKPMPGKFLGSLALMESGRLLVAVDLSLFIYDPETEDLALFAEIEKDLDNRLNDGRVDAKGRFWVGTMDNEYVRPNGAMYRIDPDGAVTKLFDEVKVTNGIAITPDNRTLYFTDTRRHTSWTFDLDIDAGTIANRTVFTDYSATGDRPDGACIDAEGRLWTAFFGGHKVGRYGPGGELDLVIEMPVSHATCICFGGPDLETLYITTASKFLSEEQLAAEPLAGALLAVDGVGRGLPEHRFAG